MKNSSRLLAEIERGSLEQRVSVVAGFLEDPAVEREPAELAIEEARLGHRLFGRSFYGCQLNELIHHILGNAPMTDSGPGAQGRMSQN